MRLIDSETVKDSRTGLRMIRQNFDCDCTDRVMEARREWADEIARVLYGLVDCDQANLQQRLHIYQVLRGEEEPVD